MRRDVPDGDVPVDGRPLGDSDDRAVAAGQPTGRRTDPRAVFRADARYESTNMLALATLGLVEIAATLRRSFDGDDGRVTDGRVDDLTLALLGLFTAAERLERLIDEPHDRAAEPDPVRSRTWEDGDLLR